MLDDALARAGLRSALRPDAAQELAAASQHESIYALSARANLQELARLAALHGWGPVVLKAGADIAHGCTVPVADVDVWLPPEPAQRLWSALTARGFTAPTPATAHHLPTSRRTGNIPIEVHHAVHRRALTDAELEQFSGPLAGCEPLRELHPAEHAWLLLVEAVFVHPERRYRLRDLRLIARAVARCDGVALKRLETRIRGSGAAQSFRQVMRSSSDPVEVDAGYRRYYMFRLRSRVGLRGRIARTVWRRAALISAEGARASWHRLQGDEAAGNHSLALRIGLHAAATVVSAAVTRGTPHHI